MLPVVALVWLGPVYAKPLEVPDEIIIKYRSDNRFSDHGRVLRRPARHMEVVRADDGAFQSIQASKQDRLWQKIQRIQRDGNVLYAEPNYLGRFEEVVPPVPDDPSYSSQWWLPAIGDRAMWALGRGEGVTVAIVDTGVDLVHPDLQSSLLSGYNFGDGNAIPQDVLGHGTQVAGIVAASQNNQIGISGLAPEAKLLPLKINVSGSSTFTSDRLASAIDYAVSHGAKVINLSLTVDQDTLTVQAAIQSALDAGVIVVAAAGNQAGAVEFPATMPGVIGVAATDQLNALASFSNVGPEITVAAPGVSVYTTALGGGYVGASGTSFSAPVVSAAVADMLSINPYLPASGFSQYLAANVVPVAGGGYAFGVLDAGMSGNSLVPHLQLNQQQFSALDSVSVDYVLPPTGGAIDVFVAVKTPLGEVSLLPDGGWVEVSQAGYVPIALGYQNAGTASGTLFGTGGPFASISLSGLPPGEYVWRTAIFNSATHRIIGDVIDSTMQLF